MKELVFLQNDQALTTSLKIAEVFERNHRDVMRDIRNLLADLEGVRKNAPSSMFQESTYTNTQNKQQPMYLMNRDGFTLLAMGFTGKKALQFKLAYIDAFNKMEKALERRVLDFHAMRQITVDNTKRLHKVIQEVVIPTARANGSNTPDKWFHANYEKLINKTIGVPAGQRPNLPYGLQSDIARLDEVVEASILKQAQAGATHKEIYASTKDTVAAYADAALLGERIDNQYKFIPAQPVKSMTIQISLF